MMRDYAAQADELRHYFDDVPMVMDAADAIEELLAERDKALNRLCEFCGICSEQSRNPFECEVAGFIPAPLPKGVE